MGAFVVAQNTTSSRLWKHSWKKETSKYYNGKHIVVKIKSVITKSVFDRFDQILIETTGLANPAPIVSVLWMDDELEAGVSLDSIVTVR